MDRRGVGMLAGLLVLAISLSGCTVDFGFGCKSKFTESTRAFTVPDNAGPTAHEAKVGRASTVAVRVVSEHAQGKALEGVPVAFSRTVVSVAPIDCPSGSSAKHTHHEHVPVAVARTDADGWVEARLGASTLVNITIGGNATYLTEERLQVLMSAAGQRAEIVVPALFIRVPLSSRGEWNTTLAAGDVPTRPPAWLNTPVKFHPDAEAQALYLRRVVEITARLAWENTATGHGDLYLGLSVAQALPFSSGVDRMQLLERGKLEETLTESGNLETQRPSFLRSGLSWASMTDRPLAAVDGLPYLIEGTAHIENPTQFRIA